MSSSNVTNAPPHLLGKTFGEILVLDRYHPSSIGYQRKVLGRCSCGTKKWFRVANLLSGASRSCGCQQPSKGPEARIAFVCVQTGQYFRAAQAAAQDAGVTKAVLRTAINKGYYISSVNGRRYNVVTPRPETEVA